MERVNAGEAGHSGRIRRHGSRLSSAAAVTYQRKIAVKCQRQLAIERAAAGDSRAPSKAAGQCAQVAGCSAAMSNQRESIDPELATWIGQQRVFFVATAPLSPNGHINTSPKGGEAFRILGPLEVVY